MSLLVARVDVSPEDDQGLDQVHVIYLRRNDTQVITQVILPEEEEW